MGIPRLPELLHLRLDVLGVIDPPQKLVSIDASLVDSRALGAFTVFGDAAMRTSWGSQAYSVSDRRLLSRIPSRAGPAARASTRRDGVGPLDPRHRGPRRRLTRQSTTNTLQLGRTPRGPHRLARFQRLYGFLQVDALVEFRPFTFEARGWGGFPGHCGRAHLCRSSSRRHVGRS